MQGVLRAGAKVRVTGFAKEALETFAGEAVAPETVDDLKAWCQEAAARSDSTVPEERLMAAIFGNMASEL
jgi:hypothetical protein